MVEVNLLSAIIEHQHDGYDKNQTDAQTHREDSLGLPACGEKWLLATEANVVEPHRGRETSGNNSRHVASGFDELFLELTSVALRISASGTEYRQLDNLAARYWKMPNQ